MGKAERELGKRKRRRPARQKRIINQGQKRSLGQGQIEGGRGSGGNGGCGGRDVNLAGGQESDGALVVGVGSVGMHQTMQCPGMSHREKGKEQRQEPARQQRLAAEELTPLFSHRAHLLPI